MDTIAKRKQNWLDFMDVHSNVNRLLVIECHEMLPKQPPLWWEKAEERMEWSYVRYQRQLENMVWLDDNTIPFMSMITGTEIFAEALGCAVYKPLDNKPFARPLMSCADDAYKVKFPKIEDTRLAELFEMADRLKQRAGKDALISFPDLQTPIDILALVWDKSDLYAAFYEEPELVKELSFKIKLFLMEFLDRWTKRYGPEFIAHYPDYYMPKGVTISEDEVGAVSVDIYREFFRGELHDIALRYGALGVHCCANAKHQWGNFKDVPNLKLLNLNQPAEILYQACDYFQNAVPLYIVDDLDLDKSGCPNEAHVAKYLMVDTKRHAMDIVTRYRERNPNNSALAGV